MLRPVALLWFMVALASVPRAAGAEATSPATTQALSQAARQDELGRIEPRPQLTVNGRVVAAEARQGWPLLIDLSGAAADGGIEVTGGGATPVAWRITPLPTRDSRKSWAVAPEQTLAIAPGEYTVRARGPTTAPAARLTLIAASTPATPPQQEEALRLRVSYLWRTGDRAAARRALADALAAAPDRIDLLVLQGDLLMAGAEYRAAADAYAKALEARVAAVKDGEENPPTGLLAKWHAAMAKARPELLRDGGK